MIVGVCVPASSYASDFLHSRVDTVKEEYYYEYEAHGKKQILIYYLHPTDDSMKDTYKQLFGFSYQFVIKDKTIHRDSDKKIIKEQRAEYRAESGVILGSGEPLQWDPEFQIIDSYLAMIAVPAQMSFIYRLRNTRSASQVEVEEVYSFIPYLGLGLGGFFGFERIDVHAFREEIGGEVHYEWHDTCYRHSFAAHALLGSYGKISDKMDFVFEIKWAWGGRGRLKRAGLSGEELSQGWGDAFAAFQHSDFNFSGWSVAAGVTW
jgi:hypothetical protein